MPEATVLVPDTGTKKAHFYQRTIGANDVLDEFVLPGEFPYASYFVQAVGATFAAAADQIITLNAGASLPVRVRRITIEQAALAGAVNSLPIDIIRITAVTPSGGTAITPRPHDSADAAAGAVSQANPTTKGTVGVTLFRRRIPLVAAQPTGAPIVIWEESPLTKPILIPTGATNGIAVAAVAGIATATCDITIEFVETNFV